jgi:YVTN family beta-propeller protein
MKKALLLILAAAAFVAIPACAQQFKVTSQVKLGGDGGWDYLAYDKAGHRLFITRGNHVMVVEARTLKLNADIPDLSGIHDVALAQEFNRGFISNGGDNTVTVFDLKTLKKLDSVKVGERPDAILYEPFSKHVFTFNARGKDSSAIDAATGKMMATIALGASRSSPLATGTGNSTSISRTRVRLWKWMSARTRY